MVNTGGKIFRNFVRFIRLGEQSIIGHLVTKTCHPFFGRDFWDGVFNLSEQ